MRKLYRVTQLDCRRESHPDTLASSSPSEKEEEEKLQMLKRNERAEMDVVGQQVDNVCESCNPIGPQRHITDQ